MLLKKEISMPEMFTRDELVHISHRAFTLASQATHPSIRTGLLDLQAAIDRLDAAMARRFVDSFATLSRNDVDRLRGACE